MTAAARAVGHELLEVREGPDEGVRADMADPEGAHTGGVDDPTTAGQGDGGRGGGGVTALACHVADRTGGPVRPRDQHVHQGRFSHPGMPDQHGGVLLQEFPDRGEIAAGPGHDHGDLQWGICDAEILGGGEVRLCQAEDRGDADEKVLISIIVFSFASKIGRASCRERV